MAKTIHIIRDYPENGISEMDIQEQDLEKLLARGWKVKEKPKGETGPNKDSDKELDKDSDKELDKDSDKELDKDSDKELDKPLDKDSDKNSPKASKEK